MSAVTPLNSDQALVGVNQAQGKRVIWFSPYSPVPQGGAGLLSHRVLGWRGCWSHPAWPFLCLCTGTFAEF